MQNFIKEISAAALALSLLSTPASAQGTYASATTNNTYANIHTVENATSNAILDKDIAAKYPEVMVTFSSQFPLAANPQWTSSKDNLWVSFSNNGRKGSASFTLKGKMNYSILNCTIDQLPGSLSKTIKKQYASYRLIDASQIEAYDAIAYQVVLESASDFITLKYTGDGVEETERIKKTK